MEEKIKLYHDINKYLEQTINFNDYYKKEQVFCYPAIRDMLTTIAFQENEFFPTLYSLQYNDKDELFVQISEKYEKISPYDSYFIKVVLISIRILKFFADNGIMYHDFKLDNIMKKGDRIVLIDFDTATVSSSHSLRLTPDETLEGFDGVYHDIGVLIRIIRNFQLHDLKSIKSPSKFTPQEILLLIQKSLIEKHGCQDMVDSIESVKIEINTRVLDFLNKELKCLDIKPNSSYSDYRYISILYFMINHLTGYDLEQQFQKIQNMIQSPANRILSKKYRFVYNKDSPKCEFIYICFRNMVCYLE